MTRSGVIHYLKSQHGALLRKTFLLYMSINQLTRVTVSQCHKWTISMITTWAHLNTDSTTYSLNENTSLFKRKKKALNSNRTDTKSTALSTGSPLKCTAISLLTSAKCLMRQDLTLSFGVHMLPGYLFIKPKRLKCDVKRKKKTHRTGRSGTHFVTQQKRNDKPALCNSYDSHSLWLFSSQFIPLGATVKAIKARQVCYPACQSPVTS